MSSRPLIRAAHMRENLARLNDLGSSNAQLVRAALRPSTIEQIDRSLAVTWLPLELDVEMTETIGRLLGDAALREWAQSSLRNSLNGPFLRPILDGAIRMFGLDPKSMLRLLPRTWDHVYRNAGSLRLVQQGRQGCAIEYLDVPARIYESNWYCESMVASFSVILEVTHTEGLVTFDKTRDGIRFAFDWARARDGEIVATDGRVTA